MLHVENHEDYLWKLYRKIDDKNGLEKDFQKVANSPLPITNVSKGSSWFQSTYWWMRNHQDSSILVFIPIQPNRRETCVSISWCPCPGQHWQLIPHGLHECTVSVHYRSVENSGESCMWQPNVYRISNDEPFVHDFPCESVCKPYFHQEKRETRERRSPVDSRIALSRYAYIYMCASVSVFVSLYVDSQTTHRILYGPVSSVTVENASHRMPIIINDSAVAVGCTY